MAHQWSKAKSQVKAVSHRASCSRGWRGLVARFGTCRPRTQGRSLPTFEVDASLAEGSREMEARRSVQLCHRCAGQRLASAPPADAATRTGGDGRSAGHGVRCLREVHQEPGAAPAAVTNGPSESTVSMWMRRGSCGSEGTTAPPTACRGLKPVCRRPVAEVHTRGQAAFCRSDAATKARGTPTRGTCIVRPTRGCTRRPTKCSWRTDTAIIASSCSTRTPARSNGCGARLPNARR